MDISLWFADRNQVMSRVLKIRSWIFPPNKLNIIECLFIHPYTEGVVKLVRRINQHG
jgi:hypothetical protein